MSSGDETYLEAFIESLGTLGYELKRNLDLIRDLDGAAAVDLERLRQLHQDYITAAERKVLELQVENGGVRVPRRPNDVIIPTTDELLQYVHNDEQLKEISQLQETCLQKAEEKASVARQAYELIDARIQRLDDDLVAMETLLESTGEFQTGMAVQPNELAACQVTPGSEWILSKVIEYDPKTEIYQLADEDIESNKIFTLPQAQVVVLRGVERLSKGDVVFAVYPDTTSFYQATVVQAPRKTTGASGQFVMVNFVDDSDEFGVTHDKAVPLKHVMLPPYAAMIE